MFEIEDVIVYGSQGVCQIVGIDAQKIDGQVKQYFVLKPKNNPSATFYVPTWNEKAWRKMRKVMTRQEIDDLVRSLPDQAPTWIPNDNERKEAYRKILANADQAAIITMLQALFLHKQEREAEGRRLHMADEHFMKDAEQILYNELQYVLNMDKAELMAYIFGHSEPQGSA